MTEKETLLENFADNNTKYKDGVNRNARLIVRNISFKATVDSLKDHFIPYGNVEEVKLLKKPDGKLVGCGFVHYTHVLMANKAITATNKKQFLGRPLYVSWAVPKNKYEEKSQNKPQIDKTKSSSEDVEENITKHVKSEKNDKNEEKAARINRNARLIIRNVSFKATEESLREHFEVYGAIHEVKLLKKPDGKLVGCAFVHYKNVPMAKKALLNTNMKPFLGRPISVDWAVAKNKYMQFMDQQQLDLQDKVKKEDPDSDTELDTSTVNISEDLKQEIKSESEAESDAQDDDEADDDDGEQDSGSDDEVDDDPMSDVQSETSTLAERKRVKLNDAEDGCTVFVTNIEFSVDSDQLRQFAERTGPVKYALVCVDKMTEHSRGTGFIKFVNKEDADKFLSLPPAGLKLEDQVMQVKPALKRESLQTGNKKQPKDNRNLYLVKEGVVVAGTKAAVGVSASDMAKRLTLEKSKTQMLKNLNRFVSRYRLVVSNLPPHVEDGRLRALCSGAVGPRTTITEARVMRDLRSPVQANGKHPSKGYGFVMFVKHEDALACLRKLNNNPDIFDKNNRPIVSFSIEDRTALNARKKRLEKSIANNPLATRQGSEAESGKVNRKRKINNKPDESKFKKGKKFQHEKGNKNKYEAGKFVKIQNGEFSEYTGLTAKEGSQHKMRTNHKLKMQADVHRQNVKLEKKTSKRALKLKLAAKERIKQPKQKINKNKSIVSEKKVKLALNDNKSFSDLVSKYKSKLVGNSQDKVKVKWYET